MFNCLNFPAILFIITSCARHTAKKTQPECIKLSALESIPIQNSRKCLWDGGKELETTITSTAEALLFVALHIPGSISIHLRQSYLPFTKNYIIKCRRGKLHEVYVHISTKRCLLLVCWVIVVISLIILIR